MSEQTFKLFPQLQPADTVAWWRDEPVTLAQFVAHVLEVTRILPEHKYAINLCDDRYYFLVCFVACSLKRQTSLLPPSYILDDIVAIAKDYKDCYCISDNQLSNLDIRQYQVEITTGLVVDDVELLIDPSSLAAIVFTSGSTGSSQPHLKEWGDLIHSSQQVQKRFGINVEQRQTIIATVPPQHMFGFELSIISPLVTSACMYADRPFYPQDVLMALQQSPFNPVLVTTPIHLRACSEAGLVWPAIDFVLSATSHLAVDLADKAEIEMRTHVLEIYGCTEAGAVASRRTTAGLAWELLEDYQLHAHADDCYLNCAAGGTTILLEDRIEICDSRHFHLKERHADIVKIAGNRGSLRNLASKLKGIAGVEDGVFFLPNDEQSSTPRLVAFVVAQGLGKDDILQQLAGLVDSAFMPRPLIMVDKLPYNNTGKLPYYALSALLLASRTQDSLQETA